MRKAPWLCAAAFLAAAALGACLTIGTSPSKGELGRVEFAWDEGFLGCLFGCDAREPLAEGASAILRVVDVDRQPPFTVSSDNSVVAEFSHDPQQSLSSIWVDTYVAGEAKVVLTEVATGETLDRFAIRVRQVARVELDSPDLYRDRLTVMIGGEARVNLSLFDSNGARLKGVGGVDYALGGGVTENELTFSGALADALVSFLVGPQEYVDIEASAPGAGQITATAHSGVALTIPVAIVEAADVTEVALELEQAATVVDGGTVLARASIGLEPVHSPECAWEISPVDGPITIGYSGRDYVALDATGPGTVEVTCTVGLASDTLSVTFR